MRPPNRFERLCDRIEAALKTAAVTGFAVGLGLLLAAAVWPLAGVVGAVTVGLLVTGFVLVQMDN